MYILSECIVGIKQKRLKEDAKKSTQGQKTSTKQIK